MIRLTEIKLHLDNKEDDLYVAACNILRIKREEIKKLVIYKKSIDARDKGNIIFVYTLDLEVVNESRFRNKIIDFSKEKNNIQIKRKSVIRPVVVGAGPAGLFAALNLAKAGFRPIIIEQGKKVDERKNDVDLFWKKGKLNISSNVQFGEGGAGTFSDGKLNTQINNPLCKDVIKSFVKFGAPEEIAYEAKPHIGTDKLIKVVKNIRIEIERLGGEFLFNEKLTDILLENGKIKGIKCKSKNVIYTDTLVLAIGHSSRDTFEMLNEIGIDMEKKAFSVGVRIEHLQEDINKAQYGNFADNKNLGAADYKLFYHSKDNRTAYTFCMCPGGKVIASSSEEGYLVTNGMSEYKRNGINANSGLLISVFPEDFKNESPLAGMYFQRELEEKAFVAGGKNYNAPVQLVGDFIKGKTSTEFGKVKPTYLPGTSFANFDDILPKFVTKTMKEGIAELGRKMKCFADKEAILTGVETRSSSPVRIVRNDNMMSMNIFGIYPCGEGAGYAGGIMSAAVDGIKCARAIISAE
jgi:uncharacterized FAD-dependent dehydrogenase